MHKIDILGVKVCRINMQQAVEEIKKMLTQNKQSYFCTPNPEIILHAQKDQDYRNIINQADLQTPDGIGLLWASEYLNTKQGKSRISKLTLLAKIFQPNKCHSVLTERVTGVELTKQICKVADQLNKKVFLLGAAEGVAQKTASILKKQYPSLDIAGTYSGTPQAQEEEKITSLINNSEAEILLVAYGAPAQEKWIARNLGKMPKIKLAGGVGGTFDFISGIKQRAPQWMQKAGIEWLYRLIIEPHRWKRIYNATIKFPWKVINNNQKHYE